MSNSLAAKATRMPRRRSTVLKRIENGTRGNAGEKTSHFRERMVERKTTWREVQEAVRTGVVERVERDKFFNNWKYRVWAKMADGSSVTVVVAIDEKHELFFVTVFKDTSMQGRKALHFLFISCFAWIAAVGRAFSVSPVVCNRSL